jgi:lysophospholipase L1-like esterase
MARISIYTIIVIWCLLFYPVGCSPDKTGAGKQNGSSATESPQWQAFHPYGSFAPDSLHGINRALRKMIAGDSVRIVCWGNSITYGFRPTSPNQAFLPYPQELQRLWQKRYRNPFIEVINLGHPGWRSEQALAHIDEVLQMQPAVCFVHFGINDAVSNYPFSEYAYHLESIARKLQQAGIEVVFLTSTPILQYAPERVNAYAQQLPVWCAQRGFACIDVHAAFRARMQREGLPINKVLPDGIHSDAPYYRWIADAIMAWWVSLPLPTDK